MDEMRAFAMLTYNRTLTAKNKAPMIDELRAIVEAAGDQGKAAPAGVSPQVAGGGKGKGKAKPPPVAGKKRKHDDDAIPVWRGKSRRPRRGAVSRRRGQPVVPRPRHGRA